ncbi:SDR family oxidoreductase [Jeotgalicoccus huakuii]|uniref:NAD(P)-dependent oxidoreductase n=1 Tax=Jeotgalicoccus sp. ATCC 8456 TaxID=946435 RepID=UPI0018E5DBDB|nr:SDR family oxidoreductase [Jeotgalicoccus sp. ATCC 8456]MCK1977166.1 SDR family oxidoreductase [Jeotgalicoccus huakuii]QQD84203.1 SDR family oxidoreductase [Jeotgalicoccus sp. ATCC 8456]
MNILVLGGTGRVGCKIVKHALRDQHHVTTLVRSPEKLQINHRNLTIIAGDVLNKEDVINVMEDIDVVISALNTDGGTTLSKSIPYIIESMERNDVKRIITIGTAGILQSRVNPEILRYQSSESRQKSTRAAEEHNKVFDVLRNSNLDWTIVCPTYLPDEESVGKYRIESGFLPNGGVKISVSDTAEFAFNQINSREFIKKRVGIAY